jgi:adenylate cyclase
VARLGEHLGAMVEPIEAAGGEVLKFLGDGLLAAFQVEPGGTPERACAAALAAAQDALRLNHAVNGRHAPELKLDVSLHLGEVYYGNIGAGRRLDFTVIGPAVNEASRLEGLCGQLGQPLLMSAPFARCCGRPSVSLGLHRLRGMAEPREVFRPAD